MLVWKHEQWHIGKNILKTTIRKILWQTIQITSTLFATVQIQKRLTLTFFPRRTPHFHTCHAIFCALWRWEEAPCQNLVWSFPGSALSWFCCCLAADNLRKSSKTETLQSDNEVSRSIGSMFSTKRRCQTYFW